ncbi:MAG: triose-phosphate transporter family-domain-containing protein [Monoraphidium minutum]|nr:MAG: triose-phosphate transporter family-domain-containing protein [Monoraphidium minutum]
MAEVGPDPVKPIVAYGCILLWVVISSATVMLNKWVLDPRLGGFPYPLTLTATHMAFCAAAAGALAAAGLVKRPPPVEARSFLATIAPIGALFALSLWLGNTAYIYLSVSLVQMIKSTMPLAVYAVGCLFGVEAASWAMLANLGVVVAGVVVATAGEVHFAALGVALQVGSIASEAVRLSLVQMLLQGSDIKLTPLSTMYYVSPVTLACLLPPLLLFEAPKLAASPAAWGRVGPGLLLGSAGLAFCLNLSALLLIGHTSALTLPLSGVLKDWLLIGLSVGLYGSSVRPMQLAGYGLSLAGVVTAYVVYSM